MIMRNLLAGSQVVIRDIAEAYRIILLYKSQWVGTIVQMSNTPKQFAINMCNCFGSVITGSLFGLFGNVLVDILDARGVGPILK